VTTRSAGGKRLVEVFLGAEAVPVGQLTYVRQFRREYSAFAYRESWLAHPEGFAVSADLPRIPGFSTHRAASPHDSTFPGGFADTEPDAWGRRVVARDHAKRRANDPTLAPLDELDYLLAVDDFSRVGALRLSQAAGQFDRTVHQGRRRTPPLLELGAMLRSSQLLEQGHETLSDLQYLRGKGTSLGGMRPKCTLIDEDGTLAIGKFPSVDDRRGVTRAEVLALRLARSAGIDVPDARVVVVDGAPVTVVRRFDRATGDERIPYQSAASLLQAARDEERSYLEIVEAIYAYGASPDVDARQLWRRMVFNLLITNVDDHLRNCGFLYAGQGAWRLAPAFDLNPFPDKRPESKTWLSESDGPVTDVAGLLARADHFYLDLAQAKAILGEVTLAVQAWRAIASGPGVGLSPPEIDQLAPAFENNRVAEAQTLLDS